MHARRLIIAGVLSLVGAAAVGQSGQPGSATQTSLAIPGVGVPAAGGQQKSKGPGVFVHGNNPQQPQRSGQGGGQPQPMPSPVVEFDLVQESVDRVSPYSPAEVRRLRSELEERERAWYENLSKKPQPKAVVSEYRLDLSPGATPPVVRVTLGHGALVTFLSADAKPWPIKDADNFNVKGMRVEQLSSHVLSVSLLSPYATGSVGVILDGLASGLTFTVVPAQTETDHRVEMIVPRMLQAGSGDGKPGEPYLPMPGFNTAELAKYLLKIPPQSARELRVENQPDVTAWQASKDRMIVRTALSVVSPAAFRRHSSADGTRVYELPLTPVITVQGPRATYQTVVINGIQVYGHAAAAAAATREATRNE